MSLLRTALESRPYEEPLSTFSCGGKLYDLTEMLKETHHLPTVKFRVKELEWMLEHGEADPVRVREADLSAPILVTVWDSKLAVVDGFHRLTKAVQQHKRELPGKLLSEEFLERYFIRDLEKKDG